MTFGRVPALAGLGLSVMVVMVAAIAIPVAIASEKAGAQQTESLAGDWIGHEPLFEQTMHAARHADYMHRVITGADHSFHVVAPSFLELTGFAPD